MNTPTLQLDADQIAAAVRACPQVAGLHGGRFGEVATYLSGRQVAGVQITPSGVFVHLVARYPADITELDTVVRAALAPLIVDVALNVVVEDLLVDPDSAIDDDEDLDRPHRGTHR